MLRKKRLLQRGDTIIEVLIAIAILSFILGITYALANRNLKDIQQAQEHTVALKIAESQVEELKQLAQSPGSTNIFPPTAPNPFHVCVWINGGSTGTLDTANDTSNHCKINNGIEYDISITRTDASPKHTFTTTVTWDSINGPGKDQVFLAYNLDN